MEFCTAPFLSAPPLPLSSLSHFPFLPSLPFNKSSPFSGVVYRRRVTVLKVTSEDESSKFTDDRRDGVVTLEDVPTIDSDITIDKVSAVYNDSRQPQPFDGDESSSDEPAQPFQDVLDNLGVKLDSEDSYIILLYGGGSLVAVWLLSAIVGAIDSIPVLPKLMEVVGLGYSLWFTTRYLLFKKNREELTAKIDELKREVLGSGDNGLRK